jgi:hypothetical protein
VNRVKRKFFSFAYWILFRMEEMRCHHEWKNNFLLLTQSRFIELALLSGPLPLKLESNDLERRTS